MRSGLVVGDGVVVGDASPQMTEVHDRMPVLLRGSVPCSIKLDWRSCVRSGHLPFQL